MKKIIGAVVFAALTMLAVPTCASASEVSADVTPLGLLRIDLNLNAILSVGLDLNL